MFLSDSSSLFNIVKCSNISYISVEFCRQKGPLFIISNVVMYEAQRTQKLLSVGQCGESNREPKGKSFLTYVNSY